MIIYNQALTEKVEYMLEKLAIRGYTQWPMVTGAGTNTGEPRLATHTWPEMGYAALDIYTCGANVKPDKAVVYAVEAFGAETSHITEITRGIDEGDAVFFHSFITWEERLRKPPTKKEREKDRG